MDRMATLGGAALAQALFWTWFYCLRYTTALQFGFLECAVMVVVSLAVAVAMALRSRLGALHARRVGTVVLGSAFATAGTLLKAGAVLSADVLAGRIAGWSSCVCIGVSMSVLFVVAMERLADLGMRDTGKALSFGALGAVALSAAVSALPFEGFAFAASALPVALGALLLSRRPSAGFSPCRHPADASVVGPCASGDGGGGVDGGERERSGTKLVAPVRPVLMMGAVEFAGCFASFPFAAEGVSSLSLAVGAVFVALVFLAGCSVLTDRFDVRMLYQGSLPLMAAGLLLGPLLSQGAPLAPCLLIDAGYFGFLFLTVTVLNENCRRHGVPPGWAFGFLRCALLASQLAGAGLVFAVNEGALARMEVELLYSASMLLIVVLSMAFLNEYDFVRSWRLSRDVPADVRPENALESHEARCALVARAFGLTRREEEVMVLVAAGKTVPQAADELFVSKETAKTHLKHVYAKLGVHTKDELAACIDGRKAGGLREGSG